MSEFSGGSEVKKEGDEVVFQRPSEILGPSGILAIQGKRSGEAEVTDVPEEASVIPPAAKPEKEEIFVLSDKTKRAIQGKL